MAKKTLTKKYISTDIIGSPDGTQRWMPGSVIELVDERALPLLEKGSIVPHPENTSPPQPPAPITQVIEAGQSAAINESEPA
jgi:hypothetical protein